MAMKKTTVTVTLTIEHTEDHDAHEVVDQVLDSGVFQDAINKHSDEDDRGRSRHRVSVISAVSS